MQNTIELKTMHYIGDKPVYCDVLTDYGMITIPFDVLKHKAKAGETRNFNYNHNITCIPNEVNNREHEHGVTLYHISFDKQNLLNKVFTPRIPSSAADLENKEIARVCFSDSISGAISAIPDGVDMLSDGDIIDTAQSDNTLYVGRITVGSDDSRLIDYNKLYNSNLVFDALSTHEYWWTLDNILLSFSKYAVEDMEESFHYIVSDDDKEEIAQAFDEISEGIGKQIRSLSGEKLYNYINFQLTKDRLTADKIGSIMFRLGIEDISIVRSLSGHYEI